MKNFQGARLAQDADDAPTTSLSSRQSSATLQTRRSHNDDVIYAETVHSDSSTKVGTSASHPSRVPLLSAMDSTQNLNIDLYPTKKDSIDRLIHHVPSDHCYRQIEDETVHSDDSDAAEYTRLIVDDVEVFNESTLTTTVSSYKVPTLYECMKELYNPIAEKDRAMYSSCCSAFSHRAVMTLLDVAASFLVYLIHTVDIEAILVATNAGLVSYFFCEYVYNIAVQLDFSILAFAVIFPLSFLIQQSFSRREQALVLICEFRALVIQTVIAEMVWNWPSMENSKMYAGRNALCSQFNDAVKADAIALFASLYRYLSMPMVSHARHLVFAKKRLQTSNIHAEQNDLIKRINDILNRFHCHSEVMKEAGFPSGEASRLHQYHWFLQQRFEELRNLKYYRTPQGARSFGRVYAFVLPWITAPYFAYVNKSAGLIFTVVLAAFEFVVLLGLLNTQKYLEDPFLELDNGFDSIRLKYELATGIQAVEQHYTRAEMLRVRSATS